MTKAASRNTKGVDLDAQAAAREAARRDGKSLGEWLHGVIADDASGSDAYDGETAGQGRVDAVTSHLERLGSRTSSTRHMPVEGPSQPRRSANRITESYRAQDDLRSARRSGHSELRTEEALQSIGKMMETSEARRLRESEAISELSQKLAFLEAKLTQQFAISDNPMKGALARLEARVDLIGKRNAAEAQARARAIAVERRISEDTETVQRLEDKLNSILHAVQVRPSATHFVDDTSHLAIRAAQKAEPASARRSLEEAIAEISQRQESLEDPAFNERQPQTHRHEHAGSSAVDGVHDDDLDVSRKHSDGSRTVARSAEPTRASAAPAMRRDAVDEGETSRQIGALEKVVRAIAENVDSLRSAGIDAARADALHLQMKELGESALALRAMTTTAPCALALEKIEQRLKQLADKVDDAFVERPKDVGLADAAPGTSALEDLVRDLARKMEAVQAPVSDNAAIDALQQQVKQLSERFARSEEGLAILPNLAASVRELFGRIETAQADVQTSAAHAAREVLRIAAGDVRKASVDASGPRDVVAPEAPQPDVDFQAQSTLGMVQSMLDEVADRLSTVENDASVVQRSPAPANPPSPQGTRVAAQRPPAPKGLPKAPDFAFGSMESPRDSVVPIGVGRRVDAATPRESVESNSPHDFIAAARHAVKSARIEPSVAALKRPPGTSAAEKASRADILAKSRDFVATHKRPMLMGLAAILVVLGTIAILQRSGLGGGQEVAIADVQPRTAVSRLARAPFASKGVSIASGDLSPRALPKAASPLASAIPGSDPVQTGSIPSLPAFAARAMVSAPDHTSLPAGLMVAAEAGNSDAQFELGARYNDGRSVPRDLKLAAQWLEKAANQGSAPAQYRLASMYEKGAGVTQDKTKARSLYTKAADAGNPRAMHNLAVMLADGDGHPDYAGAVVWFRKAAAFGIHDSQYNLAILLARGLGVQQSLVQSYQWFAVAAAKNDPDAARKRDEVATKMNPNDLAVAKAMAVAFQPKTPIGAAVEIQSPPGGWDGATGSSRINTAKSKISSL